ncbi:MAG: hypothetical protein ACJ77M_10705 [Thermoleophilaceae bacterium]|jgi:hypothetical protein
MASSNDDKPRRVDLGFSGGQVLALRLKADVYEKLRKALETDNSPRWHEVKSEDSDVSVDLSQVVYVRLDTERHSVGF